MAAEHKVRDEHWYEGMRMSGSFPASILDRVRNEFQLRDDDVIIATYPKAGTTWFQEIIWLVMNDVDVSRAATILQDFRVPFLEIDKRKVPLDIDILENASSPRIYKTHLPYRFFEDQLSLKKTKLVLGARNIKDTLVSFYHFSQMNQSFALPLSVSFNDFFDEVFKKGRMTFGNWFEYNLDYWNNRDKYNLFVLKYEDLHKDPGATIKRLAAFLGKDITDEQVDRIVQFCAFGEMKVNKQVNKVNNPRFNHQISPFMRKGKVGDWKATLTVAQNEYVNALYEEKIKGTGLEFDFEI